MVQPSGNLVAGGLTSERLAALPATLISQGREAALPIARSLAMTTGPGKAPGRVSRALSAQVFLRDHFTCRYCGRRTVLATALELLARVFPEELPFESHHYPAGRTHPAFTGLTASIDHVVPIARGGSPADPENLVTACWPCNAQKGEFPLQWIGFQVRPIIESGWLGLVDHYAQLWVIAGRPNPKLHLDWMRAFGAPRAEQPWRGASLGRSSETVTRGELISPIDRPTGSGQGSASAAAREDVDHRRR